MPVIFDPTLTPEDLENIHYGEVGLRNGQLAETSGAYGWTLVATGTWSSYRRGAAERQLAGVAHYYSQCCISTDIGARLVWGDLFAREAARSIWRRLRALMRTCSTYEGSTAGVRTPGCGLEDEGNGRSVARRDVTMVRGRNTRGVAAVEGTPMP